jgi:hypothetical protein
MDAVRIRNASGGRVGLQCVVGDVAEEPPTSIDSQMRFDLVVDKVKIKVINILGHG